MKILLTGGTGYIGSHAAVTLLQAGHEVILFDNFCNSDKSVLGRIERITEKPINFVQGDVRDVNLVFQVLKKYSIDSVVHFAGLKAVGESVSNPLLYYSNNVQGTIGLLRAMEDAGVRTLVFSSSATVYGAPKYLPYDEEHPAAAINPYGRTKLQVEDMLRDIAASNSSWRVATLRYFNPVGAHESGLIGEAPSGVPNNIMPFISQVAVGQRPFLNVFGNDYDTCDGTGVRDYIHVVDLVEGHLAALSFLQKNNGWHAFNLGTGEGTSVLQLVHAFEEASGKLVPYKIQNRRPGDLPKYFACADKAKELLQWKASRNLNDMCASAWRWQKYATSL